ncbi:MAG: hypothetical protein AB2A00_43580, partial [Myxococcota bacterium]
APSTAPPAPAPATEEPGSPMATPLMATGGVLLGLGALVAVVGVLGLASGSAGLGVFAGSYLVQTTVIGIQNAWFYSGLVAVYQYSLWPSLVATAAGVAVLVAALLPGVLGAVVLLVARTLG